MSSESASGLGINDTAVKALAWAVLEDMNAELNEEKEETQCTNG